MDASAFFLFILCFQTGFTLNQTAMEVHGVVPDVIDVAPTSAIHVMFEPFQIFFHNKY